MSMCVCLSECIRMSCTRRGITSSGTIVTGGCELPRDVENKFTMAMVHSQDLDKIKAFKLSIWMGGA